MGGYHTSRAHLGSLCGRLGRSGGVSHSLFCSPARSLALSVLHCFALSLSLTFLLSSRIHKLSNSGRVRRVGRDGFDIGLDARDDRLVREGVLQDGPVRGVNENLLGIKT